MTCATCTRYDATRGLCMLHTTATTPSATCDAHTDRTAMTPRPLVAISAFIAIAIVACSDDPPARRSSDGPADASNPIEENTTPDAASDAAEVGDGQTHECFSIPDYMGQARLENYNSSPSYLCGEWQGPPPEECYVIACKRGCGAWVVTESTCADIAVGQLP